ncbi:hypothetical protein E4U55_004595 [Claviceps digitariae]|nr:hypothetical protein E4U55_004595 [Claviceps digitariae]
METMYNRGIVQLTTPVCLLALGLTVHLASMLLRKTLFCVCDEDEMKHPELKGALWADAHVPIVKRIAQILEEKTDYFQKERQREKESFAMGNSDFVGTPDDAMSTTPRERRFFRHPARGARAAISKQREDDDRERHERAAIAKISKPSTCLREHDWQRMSDYTHGPRNNAEQRGIKCQKKLNPRMVSSVE